MNNAKSAISTKTLALMAFSECKGRYFKLNDQIIFYYICCLVIFSLYFHVFYAKRRLLYKIGLPLQ